MIVKRWSRLALHFLFLAVLVAHVNANNNLDNEDLVDFEFVSDVKPSASNDSAPAAAATENKERFDSAFDEFLDIIVEPSDLGSQIQQKEMRVKNKLAKAWNNPNMQRKFAEVLPILKVMTSQQKIALAALVSAQVGAKQGRELNLDQVKVMFGDRKELILPLVLDIANLVRMAADSNDSQPQSAAAAPTAEFLRAPAAVPEAQPHAIDSAMHDDRLGVDFGGDEPKIMDTKNNNHNEQRAFLVTRSAPFYDHLMKKMVPNMRSQMAPKKMAPILQRRVDSGSPPAPPSNLPLNQRPFVVPSTSTPFPEGTTTFSFVASGNESFNEVEDLALNGLNGTYVEDSEALASDTGMDAGEDADDEDEEHLPTAEKLIGGRYRKKPHSRYSHRKPGYSGLGSPSLCEKFTGSVCLRVEDYPMDQIMGSIRRHKYAMGALLAEYRDKSDDVEHIDYSNDFNTAYHRRREDETGQPSPGAMCPSLIRYARPQKARSASGEWKYIVNTGQHTQTLRLEKCSKPQESCTYLTDNFRSRCIQVYNYHRLLSWDKTRGLHVDIFKVPTCCSCRIDGYKEVFPPTISGSSSHYSFGSGGQPNTYHIDDYRPAATNIRSPYSTIHHHHGGGALDEDDEDEEENEDDDEEDDSVGYQYSNGFKRKKATKPAGFDSFLSPPVGKYESIPFKRGPSTSSVPSSIHGGGGGGSSLKKRPSRTNNRDLTVAGSRSDTIISPKLPLTTETIRRSSGSAASTATTTTTNVKVEHPKGMSRHKLERETVAAAGDQEQGSTSRVNYNYHPIIDFFGESAEEKHSPMKEARTGEQGGDWRPMVNGVKSF